MSATLPVVLVKQVPLEDYLVLCLRRQQPFSISFFEVVLANLLMLFAEHVAVPLVFTDPVLVHQVPLLDDIILDSTSKRHIYFSFF